MDGRFGVGARDEAVSAGSPVDNHGGGLRFLMGELEDSWYEGLSALLSILQRHRTTQGTEAKPLGKKWFDHALGVT